MGKVGFRLSKYYLDCVTSAGDAVIAYAATLKWHGLSVSYASILCAPPNSTACSTVSLEHFRSPHSDSTGISWQHAALGFRGRWSIDADAAPIQRDLLVTQDGAVTWTCLAHHASATIRYGQRTLTGLGYVEHLQLTLAPWQIPIDCLRWGRFLSPTDSLVWLQWRGTHPLDLLWHNGEDVSASATIDDRRVTASHLALDMPAPQRLRDGSLLNTVFASVPRLAALFPGSILRARQTKWLSPATFQTPAGVSAGLAIHELVTFVEGIS
jgi:hypothetical protein